MSSWFEPNPAPGLAITSAWGNAVEDASWPPFATLAALQAQWTGAPDGADAYVLGERRTYERRGGTWLLPLTQPQGLVGGTIYNIPNSSGAVAIGNQPGTQVGESGAVPLRGKRTYVVQFRSRIQVVTVNPANPNTWYVGYHLNARGTLLDSALTWTGGNAAYANGQQAMVETFPMGWAGAVRQGSGAGALVTAGADDQVLAVFLQLVGDNSAGYQFTWSDMWLTFVDVGPAA